MVPVLSCGMEPNAAYLIVNSECCWLMGASMRSMGFGLCSMERSGTLACSIVNSVFKVRYVSYCWFVGA